MKLRSDVDAYTTAEMFFMSKFTSSFHVFGAATESTGGTAVTGAVLAIVATLALSIAPFGSSADAQGAKPFKVAYIPCGRVNDQSWSQAGYEGIVAAKKDLGIEVAYSESVPPADVEAAARDYAAKGFNLVMLHCGTFTDPGLKVAKDFPDTWFEVASAQKVLKNVISINLGQQEGAFAAGVMAGLATKSNRLGAIVAYNTLGFNRQVEGFRLGARFANPKVELYVTYLNSAEDAAKAKEATLAQIDAGADIILAATDQAATGVFRASEERGKFVIAEYANQNAIAPKVILASILYNQAKLISTVIKSVVSGTASGGIQEPGIALGVGTIVENGPLMATIPADAIECMHLVSNSIVDGSIRVPSQVALGREGAAKAMDPKMVIPSGTHACFNKRQ
jgi:basic membrane lipoprotein Med (substrate-binding protein (PBP1-ABC) superfamily)